MLIQVFVDPCSNGGTCEDLVDNFMCTCRRGYTGLRCEEDVDECLSSPCQNQATCSNYVDSFVCSCAVS